MLEDVRDAVVTIQGGGIYGLSVLGQAQHILEEQKFTPLAFAGTSAGAIVATLLWARLSRSQIMGKFVEYAKKPGLAHLLGPFERQSEDKFDLDDFLRLGKTIDRFVKASGAEKLCKFYPLKRKVEKHFARRGVFCGDAPLRPGRVNLFRL